MRLNEQVYQGVKYKILSGEYKPNDILSEKFVAEEFGVSKAPVRTALHRLCQEGYMASYARKGYLILNTDSSDNDKLSYARFATESAVIEYLIQNCSDREIESLRPITQLEVPDNPDYGTVNEQFHMEMAKLTNNQYLVNTVKEYLSISSRMFDYASLFSVDIQDASYHSEILNSILARDLPLALNWLKKDYEW